MPDPFPFQQPDLPLELIRSVHDFNECLLEILFKSTLDLLSLIQTLFLELLVLFFEGVASFNCLRSTLCELYYFDFLLLCYVKVTSELMR